MTFNLRIAKVGAIVAVTAVSGCTPPSQTFALRCDVAIDEVAPTSASAGDSVVLTGTPFTSTYDSAVYVGTERADVLDVQRSNCSNCDLCRNQQSCTECSDCDACDTICSNECVETVTFAVPNVEPGVHALQLFNAHGQTSILDLTVESTGYQEQESDTGTDDSRLSPPPSSMY
jgi:hypothetical protein